MKTNKMMLAALDRVAKKDPDYWKDTEYRMANERWLKRSFRVATKVLLYLKSEGITKRELAERMGVSAQYVGKILKGKENFTFETIDKLEQATGLSLMVIPGDAEAGQRQDHAESVITQSQLSYVMPKVQATGKQDFTQRRTTTKRAICSKFTQVHLYSQAEMLYLA